MNSEISQLLEKLLNNSLDANELHQLQLLAKDPENDHYFDEFILEVMLQKRVELVSDYDKQEMLNQVFHRIGNDSAVENEPSISIENHRRRSLFVNHWWKYAAVVFILIGTATYLWFNNRSQKASSGAVIASSQHDVPAPANARAVLTLANGQTIFLDSADDGTLARQGNIDVKKLSDGQILYDGASASGAMEYNKLEVPRGSKVVAITLSDNTKVWLNAGSILNYPVSFTGTERSVSINGEGYFEVAHDPQKPFKVRKGEMEINVLGTHFNVNTYNDEKEIKITLLEGKVNVINNNESIILLPMQQAAIMDNNSIQLKKQIDAEEVMAWKNGFFSFKGATIETIMREIARWYNVQVEYKGVIKERFNVEIGRNTNVSKVFKILETTGAVHFIIDQNKIVVIP